MLRYPLAIAVLFLAAVGAVRAQAPSTSSGQAYPTRTVRVIVPFPPGGSTDILARGMGGQLAAWIRSETAKWAKIVKLSGAKPE